MPSARGLTGSLKQLFHSDVWLNAAFGMGGLAVSLWAPKLAAERIHESLGRGYGGVATAAVGTALASSVVAMVPGGGRASRGMFVGGMIGVATMLLSAISCKTRMTLLPFEEQMIACSLPTAPAGGSLASLLSSLGAPSGVSGLRGSADAMIAAEANYRRQMGLRDYVNSGQVVATIPGSRRIGVSDYVNVAGPALSASGLTGPEQF